MPTRALIRSIWGLSALLAALTIGAAPALAHAKVHGPKRAFGRGTSTNWSGYAVDGSNATSVAGSWTQPAVSCGINENSWSSPWVGIDGDNSNTVEQIGTDSDCQNGKAVYYAWYEMYPKSLVTIPMTVTAGHTYVSSVTYSPTSGTFTLTLADQTAGTTPYTTTQSSRKARRSSAEWIMEGPSSGLLTNFGSVPFSSASGTIGGLSVGPGSSNAIPIKMVSSQGTTRAVPTLTSTSSFSVDWKHS